MRVRARPAPHLSLRRARFSEEVLGTLWFVPACCALAALVVPLAAWALAEIALLRVLIRPLPAQGADVPVDEALRTWVGEGVAYVHTLPAK